MKKVAEYVSGAFGNDWARGCAKCKFGIASAPPLTGACELNMERLCQAISKQLIFCDCQAGTRYRVFLLNRRQKLIEEARRDPRMQEQARRLTHPDIEVAQARIEQSYEYAPAPTIHMEAQPVEVMEATA